MDWGMGGVCSTKKTATSTLEIGMKIWGTEKVVASM